MRRFARSFITTDVWHQYIETAKHLLPKAGGLAVLTTVIENAPLLAETLGARPNMYLPSIPNLPYQVGLEGPPLNATTWMNPKTCRPPRAASRTL